MATKKTDTNLKGTTRNINMTKRDIANCVIASEKVEDYLSTPLRVLALHQYVDDVLDQESNEKVKKTICCFKCATEDNNTIYISSPSESLAKFYECIYDLAFDPDDTDDIMIEFITRKSNNGRNFYTGKLI